MNKRHPFGLPIWKPALYKKSRSVVRRANRALHSSPSSSPELFLDPGNLAWLVIFGWWLSLLMFVISVILLLVPPDGYAYGRVMRELASYLLWPFGRYVEHHGEAHQPTPLSPTTSVSSRAASISSTSSTLSNNNHDEEDRSVISIDDEDEETCLLQDKRKRKQSMLRSVMDVIKSPGGCAYYVLYYIIIGKSLIWMLWVISCLTYLLSTYHVSRVCHMLAMCDHYSHVQAQLHFTTTFTTISTQSSIQVKPFWTC